MVDIVLGKERILGMVNFLIILLVSIREVNDMVVPVVTLYGDTVRIRAVF